VNNVKTFILMAGLMGLFLVLGQMLGGTSGLVMALVLGSAMNFIMYFFSDRMVLRMYRAKVVTAQEAPELYALVDRLRQRAGLPMPVVAVAPHEQPNAFATGRSPEKAVVAVTTGILKFMPQDELEGVIAHELAHIKNRDMLISTIAAGFAGAIGYLPYLLMFGGPRRGAGGHAPRAGGGHDHSNGRVPPAGVRGRPGGRPDPRPTRPPRPGPDPSRYHGPPDPHGRDARRGAPRAGQPARGPRRRHRGTFQHPSPHGGTRPSPDGARPVILR